MRATASRSLKSARCFTEKILKNGESDISFVTHISFKLNVSLCCAMAISNDLRYSRDQKVQFATKILEDVKDKLVDIANQLQGVEILLNGLKED